MPTWEDIRRIGATLPGNEERDGAGGRTLYVRRKYYAWECHPWPSIEPVARAIIASEPVAAVKVVDDMEHAALVEGWPDVFLGSTTRWGGPKVAFRLATIDPQLLVELVTEAWRTQAPQYLRREFDAAEGAGGAGS